MKRLINILIAVIILASAVLTAKTIIGMKPKALVKPQVNLGVLVEATVVQSKNQEAVIIGQGIVEPAERVNLIAQVSGLVQKINSELSVGGRVPQNFADMPFHKFPHKCHDRMFFKHIYVEISSKQS